MRYNIGVNRNLYLKPKSEMGLYHDVTKTAKTSTKKLTLIVIEMKQLPDIEEFHSKEDYLALNEPYIMVGEKYV